MASTHPPLPPKSLRPRSSHALLTPPLGMSSAAASSSGAGPRVYEEGQDPKELFDLYEPPTPEQKAGAKVTALRPLGRRKARALVHAEGDWHRWVGGFCGFGVLWFGIVGRV